MILARMVGVVITVVVMAVTFVGALALMSEASARFGDVTTTVLLVIGLAVGAAIAALALLQRRHDEPDD